MFSLSIPKVNFSARGTVHEFPTFTWKVNSAFLFLILYEGWVSGDTLIYCNLRFILTKNIRYKSLLLRIVGPMRTMHCVWLCWAGAQSAVAGCICPLSCPAQENRPNLFWPTDGQFLWGGILPKVILFLCQRFIISYYKEQSHPRWSALIADNVAPQQTGK